MLPRSPAEPGCCGRGPAGMVGRGGDRCPPSATSDRAGRAVPNGVGGPVRPARLRPRRPGRRHDLRTDRAGPHVLDRNRPRPRRSPCPAVWLRSRRTTQQHQPPTHLHEEQIEQTEGHSRPSCRRPNHRIAAGHGLRPTYGTPQVVVGRLALFTCSIRAGRAIFALNVTGNSASLAENGTGDHLTP